MSRPIVLWNPSQSASSDDAGTTIIKSVLPPPVEPGPYEVEDRHEHATRFRYVPSLAYFAIRKLIEYPDQIDIGLARIHYTKPSSSSEYDILRALMPSFTASRSSSLSNVDPRLWAVIIQVFANLPKRLRSYSIPLSDKHLPLLQRVPSTAHFSLITILEIPGCRKLTDITILELKTLHGLCALDASATTISGLGIRRLSGTLFRGEEGQSDASRGPWRLRMLRLRYCVNLDNTVFPAIAAFPLLCVVDLRGTKCIPDASVPNTFVPTSKVKLYDPTPIWTSLRVLSSECDTLFSSQEHFLLHVDSLHHNPRWGLADRRPSAVAMQDVCVVFPAPGSSDFVSTTKGQRTHTNSTSIDITPRPRIIDSHTVSRQTELREELRGCERYPVARLELLKRMSERLQEVDSDLPGHPYRDEEMKWDNDFAQSMDQDDYENESSWVDESDNEDDSANEWDDGNEAGEYTETSDEQHDTDLGSILESTEDEGENIQLGPRALSFRSWFNSGFRTPFTIGPSSGETAIDYPDSQDIDAIDLSTTPNGVDLTELDSQANSTTLEGRSLTSPPLIESVSIHDSIATRKIGVASPESQSESNRTVVDHALSDDLSTSSDNDTSDHADSLFDDSSSLKRTVGIIPPQPVKKRRIHEHLGTERSSEFLRGTSGCPSITEAAAPLWRKGSASPTSHPRNLRPSDRLLLNQPEFSAFSDFQNAIVETEMRELRSREAAKAFYSGSSSKLVSLARARKIPRQIRHVPIRDELLMLYRDPPAWDTVDKWKPTGSSKASRKDSIENMAVLNKANLKGKEGIRALTEMINRKKRMSILEKESVKSNNAPESRNPFRPKSKSIETRIKPLVPISTIPVPVLSRETQEKAKVNERSLLSTTGYRGRKLSATKRTPSESKSVKGCDLSVSGEKKKSGKQRPNGSGLGNESRGVSRPRLDIKTGSVKGKNKSTFDWKAWSSKQ